MSKFERALFVGGVSVLVAFVSSWLILSKAHYHTLIREAAFGTLGAAGALVILWVLIAGVFAALHWRTTSIKFRIAMALNIAITAVLIADFFHFHGQS
jgi:hypothetical protein